MVKQMPKHPTEPATPVRACFKIVAQTSGLLYRRFQPACSPSTRGAAAWKYWKSAIEQVWKPARHAFWHFETSSKSDYTRERLKTLRLISERQRSNSVDEFVTYLT